MSDKKRKIMETAVKYFAEKGYHATSIQEIADSLGIAKGSLYFYFKSKEDLLVQICKYFITLFIKKIVSVMEDPDINPRERLAQQVVIKSEQFTENHDFITMLMKERFEANEEIHQLMHKLTIEITVSTRNCILEIYGEEVNDYAYDAALMFNSLSDGYLGLKVMHRLDLSFTEVSKFLVKRLDDLVKGMIAEGNKPLLDSNTLNCFLVKGLMHEEDNTGVLAEIQALRETAEESDLAPETVEEIEASLQVLEEEFTKASPQPVLVKGMITLLKSMKIQSIKKNIEDIEKYI